MKTFPSVALLTFSLIISSSLWGMEVKEEENKDKNRSSPTTTAERTHHNRDQAAQHDANSGSSNPNNGSPTAVLTSTSKKSPSQDRNTSSNQNMSNRIPDEKLGTSYSSTGAPRANAPRAEGELGPYTVSLSDERPSENTPRFPQPHSIFSSFREQELPRIDGVNPELVSAWINAQSDEERWPIFSTMVNNISSLNRSQMSDQDQYALLERLNQIKQEHYVENVTSDRRVKAAGGGERRIPEEERTAAPPNILNRLSEKELAAHPAEFLLRDAEEKRGEYEQNYNEALNELRTLAPEIAQIFQDPIPEREDLEGWQQRVSKQFPQFQDRQEALKFSGLINRADALRRAIAILGVARDHKNRFLKAINASHREKASHTEKHKIFYYSKIESINKTLSHLEEATASTLELAGRINAYQERLARNPLQNETDLIRDCIVYAREMILLNTEYATAIRDGNMEGARALYDQSYQVQGRLYEVQGRLYQAQAVQAIRNGNHRVVTNFRLAAEKSGEAREAIVEGQRKIAAWLEEAATYYAEAALAELDGRQEDAHDFSERANKLGIPIYAYRAAIRESSNRNEKAARCYTQGAHYYRCALDEKNNRNNDKAAEFEALGSYFMGAAEICAAAEFLIRKEQHEDANFYRQAANYYVQAAEAELKGEHNTAIELKKKGEDSLELLHK